MSFQAISRSLPNVIRWSGDRFRHRPLGCRSALFLLLALVLNSKSYAQEGRATIDLGISSGKSQDIAYTEVNAGMTYHFMESLALRNSAFVRLPEEGESFLGLDTSLRAYLFSEIGQEPGWTLYAGPGLRLPTRGQTVPFAEGGAIFHSGSFSIGLGTKALFHSWIEPGRQNEAQLLIILAIGHGV